MRIQFIKNIHFTRLLKINDRAVKEFNFRKIKQGDDELFSIDVSDDRGNRIMFQVHKDDDKWQIVNATLPAWIADQETKLSEIIEEELKNLQD